MAFRMTLHRITIDEDQWGSTTIKDGINTERDPPGYKWRNLRVGCIEKKIREAHNSWSGHEKETRPPKRLVRIEDCHLEIWTEWIGVRKG